jgi:hypothetical protein
MTPENFSNLPKESKPVTCTHCNYKWNCNTKRPNPRFITCPNCRDNVELRESKLD